MLYSLVGTLRSRADGSLPSPHPYLHLEPLIRVIDAQLLKPIDLKALKSKDVQNVDPCPSPFAAPRHCCCRPPICCPSTQRRVYPPHNVPEESNIHAPAQRASCCRGLRDGVVHLPRESTRK